MNEGFFTTSQIKLCAKAKLPPRLKIEVPPAVGVTPKPKPDIIPLIPQAVMDIECYINYFLVKFKTLADGEYYDYELTSGSKLAVKSLEAFLHKHEIITFNGNTFDVPILRLALTGANNRELKHACNELIQTDIAVWQFEKKHNLPKFNIKHIDLIEVLPNMVSLKIYGGRLGCKKMQDLPYPEESVLTEDQMDKVCEYCGNDLDLTELAYKDITPQIELRRAMSKKYKMDLLSKSDAQIAEAVIKEKYLELTKVKLDKVSITKGSFYYDAPDFIQFTNPLLKEALEIVTTKPFTMSNAGRPIMPVELTKLKVKIGGSVYKLGMGGLHSTEKSAFHVSCDKFSLYDWDVTSFYPTIMLLCNLYPEHMGEIFLDIFEPFVIERVEAKAKKDTVTADSFKTLINGTFGKLGQPYSVINSPNLMVQVTVTGQLSLLMLIDMLETKGIPVISGNTDGVVLKCPVGKEDMMYYIIKRWEKQTGFTMESNKYAGIYSRDVNNYLAFAYKYDKENKVWLDELDKVKQKGIFSDQNVKKNPENDICTDAMIEYIKYGTPFKQTIRACFDINKFVTVRSVHGGATKDGVYLGKAIRFYHAKGEKGSIYDRKTKSQVAMTEGTKPIMDISGGLPNDIDYDWYENACSELFGK